MTEDWNDLDLAVLGAGIPAPAEALITQAGEIRAHTEQALTLLEQALALAPGHPACLIALYRFHFYGNRLTEARRIAKEAIRVAAERLGLPDKCESVPAEILAGELSPLPRFYLFSLKGYAYLSLRLGELDDGRHTLVQLARLDPGDQTGHAVLSRILDRLGHEDDDYEELAHTGEVTGLPEGMAS